MNVVSSSPSPVYGYFYNPKYMLGNLHVESEYDKIEQEEQKRLLIEKDKLKNLRATEKNKIESTKNENTNFEKNENLVTFIN